MRDSNQTLTQRLYETKDSADLSITFNCVPYQVHSLVLGMTSNYFGNLFLSKVKVQRMDIELDIPYISQDAFVQFLKYCYGWELDNKYVMPMLSLSVCFECNKLWKKCKKYRLYNVSFSETHALHLFHYIVSNFTLEETEEVINDNLLVDCVVWFTVHFDKILELKLETLKLIPLEWLRYVFGKAPFHVFKNELDRLEKACQLYFKLGESAELFSALCEGIRFKCIPLRDMCDEKYSFLYQSNNNVMLDNLLSPRIFDMSLRHNDEYFKKNPTLVIDLVPQVEMGGISYSLAKNLHATTHYRGVKENAYSFSLVLHLRQKTSIKYDIQLQCMVFTIRDNFQSWDQCSFTQRGITSFIIKVPWSSSDPSNMVFKMNILALTVDYWGTKEKVIPFEILSV
jgi:hypothetical protein